MSSHTPVQMRVDLVDEGPFSRMYSAHQFDPLNPAALFREEAGANLFAAAPELLEALMLCQQAGLRKHILNTGESLASAIDAAIAKATGQ